MFAKKIYTLRQKQFNLLIYGQNSIKTKSVSWQKNVFFFPFPFLGSAFCKEEIFFPLTKGEKPVTVSVHSIYSLCYKI